MAELITKMHTLSSATLSSDQPRADKHASSSSKMVPARTPDPPLILKVSPTTVTKAPQPSEVAKKHTRVNVCEPNAPGTIQLQPTLTLTRTQDRGADPVTTTSSVIDLTDTKLTAGSQTSSVEDDTYVTAKVRTTGTGSMLAGNPCASRTHKKNNPNRDLSVQANIGSQDNSAAASDEGGVIFPEKLQFTAALSKAMSEDLALYQLGATPYKSDYLVCTGDIKKVLLMARSLSCAAICNARRPNRIQSIISHLEGEERNYIINKAETSRDTPEKVFELLASRFGTGGNRMQERQAFATRQQSEKVDWMQYLDDL